LWVISDVWRKKIHPDYPSLKNTGRTTNNREKSRKICKIYF